MHLFRSFLVCLLLILALAPTAYSKDIGGDDDNPFTLSFEEGPIVVSPGEKVLFNAHFEIPPEYYLYADKMTIEVSSGLPAGPIEKVPGVLKHDSFSNETVEVHYDQVDLSMLFTIPENLTTEQVVKGRIIFQGCSTELCYRVMKIPFEVTYVLKGQIITPPEQSNTESNSILNTLRGAISDPDIGNLLGKKSYGLTLLVAFVGGVLSDLTPCVWPMIPITMIIIGVRRDKSWGQNLLAVSVMVLGMAVMYSLLGVASALLGKSLGFLFQQTFFLWLIAAVMLLMSISLLGLFEIKLPSSFLTRLSKITASGYRGIFLVGVTLGVLAAPCVGPVIGSILVYIAQTQDVWLGFWLMLFYALGMGSLFILMGVLYRTFKLQSKSGAWTVVFKKLMGVIILGIAIYYGSIAFQQSGAQAPTHGYWLSSLTEGMDASKKSHKPVVIDFYAQWCLPCKELDEKVWSQPSIKEELTTHFEAVHIDCTQDTPECSQAVERFKVIGWPTVVFLNKELEEVKTERLVGKVISAEEMLVILRRIKSL